MAHEHIETEAELSKLKDDIELFKESPIWNHIVMFMQKLYQDAAEEALGADEIGQVKWAKGIAHAVRLISTFDETIPLFKRAKEAK
jgi:hypothetical protein